MLADLTERVTEHRVTALLGPRRFGKTSVLRRLAHDLTKVSTVAIDLFGVQTHADIVLRLAAAMQEAVPRGPRRGLRAVGRRRDQPRRPPCAAAAVPTQTPRSGGADHARRRLLADEKLRTDGDGNVVVTDPLLADWLRQTLPL